MKTNNKKVEDNFYGKRVVKGIFAKAKFDKSNYYALEGTVDGMAAGAKTVENIEEAMYYGKAMLEHMKKQSPKAKVTTVHIYKVVNYQRENTPVKVLNSRTGAKAKFAKEYVMWGLPKGSTNRLDEKVMAEGLYTPAQVDDVKRRASAAGWHSFRVVAMMSFDDMINAFKGKGIKRRSSRTGSKAKFANGVYGNEEIAKGLSQVLKILGFDAMASGILTGPKDNETLRKYIRALKSKMSPMSSNERGMVLLQILEKQLASRTGFKTKFSHLSTMLDMLDYQSANDQEDLARKNIKGLAQSIGKLNPTKDEWSRYVKIAKSLGFSESQISGFARIGAKVFK